MILAQPPDTNMGGYWHGIPQAEYIVLGQWVKLQARWETTEPQSGVYDWSYLDAAVAVVRSRSGKVLINIHNTPAWARNGAQKCRPPDDLRHLARFAQMIVSRYKPEAVSIWNEPEMDAATAASLENCCGCVGPDEYRRMVNTLYSGVAWGETLMVAGELLGNRAWIAQAFSSPWHADAIAYHHYQYGLDTNPAGLVSIRDYLRQRSSLPLWLTETALLSDTDGAPFRLAQADWMWAARDVGHPVMIWYSQSQVDWRNCNLVNEFTRVRYPAFYAMQELILRWP
jgi:hypothetical protein